MTKAERDKRYSQSSKGKETQKRKLKKYRQTENGKKVNNKISRNWQINNPEKKREAEKKYRQSDKGKLIFTMKSQRYRSRKKNLPSTLTADEWLEILENQGNKCNNCKVSFEKVKATQDHIVPVSKGGAYTKENIQALCGSCNSSKRDRQLSCEIV